MRRRRLPLVLALLALLGQACELRVATDIIVASDHTGEVVVSVALDDETAQDLVEVGLVPTAGLEEAAAAAPGWRVESIEGLEAGVRLHHAFEDPAEVGMLLAALSADLGVEDGALWDGLGLREQADGSLVLHGRAGIVAPTVVGAEGDGITFDGADLAALLAEQGRAAVRHDLQVSAAGGYGAHDADRELDGTLVWELPTGQMRPVSAELPVGDVVPWMLWTAVALAALVVAFLATWLWRRRPD